MNRASHFEPARVDKAASEAYAGFSVSPADDQGNRFITVLGDDGNPRPVNESTIFDKEGA